VTTGQALVDAAASFLGEPYSTAPGRTSPTSGYKDCSGLIAAAYEVATGSELGAYVSVTIWKQSADQGLAISRDEALTIAGACLLIPDNPLQGWGPNGHIGFSTGDGFTIEATPAARGGVQRLPVTFQPWGPAACLLPGITYGTAPVEEDERMKPRLLRPKPNGKTWVYDPNTHTKTWVRTSEALDAYVFLFGIGIDTNPGWAGILEDARDTDDFSATSGGAAKPLTVNLTGTAQ
jgi:hypothetical protein